jgi:uncharacterized Fe-S center protein
MRCHKCGLIPSKCETVSLPQMAEEEEDFEERVEYVYNEMDKNKVGVSYMNFLRYNTTPRHMHCRQAVSDLHQRAVGPRGRLKMLAMEGSQRRR